MGLGREAAPLPDVFRALVLAAVLLAPVAGASHMGLQRGDPVQHDQQGRSDEPDGLRTSVLGPTLTNCVLELPGTGFAGRCLRDPVSRPGFAATLAPGCTGSDGDGQPLRREAGQCGLWTVGVRDGGVQTVPAGVVPPPVSERGMGGASAPGGYTPLKGSTLRFLDGRIDAASQVATTFVLDVNHAGADLAGLGDHVLPGDAIVWAWFGQWTDRNGNGVIDALTPGSAGPTANEFTWLGSCTGRDGARNPDVIAAGVCQEDPNPNLAPPGEACADPASTSPCAGATLVAWLFPGNHHSNALSGDAPGNQLVAWASHGFSCAGPPACDDADRDLRGDPLLGAQAEVAPDMTFQDRTGDAQDAERQWVGGTGATSTFYGDDGLLVTLVAVYGVDCPASQSLPWRWDLTAPPGQPGGCTFLDVDRDATVSPAVETLVVGDPEQPTQGLKGLARGAWLLVRDGTGTAPAQRFLDGLVQGAAVYETTQGPLRGTLDDILLAPGWSREPNTPPQTLADGTTIEEEYVGVRYRACSALPVGDARNPTAEPDLSELEAQHRGWCNASPSGGVPYDAYRGAAYRGWNDAHAMRSAVFLVPISTGGVCGLCITWALLDVPAAPEPTDPPVGPAEDHGRALGPGQWYFAGRLGRWHDAPHAFDESVFPDGPGTTTATYPADGWVGVLARATGQWRYRGFGPVACPTEQDAALAVGQHDAAECNPYLDGSVEDPQDHTVEEGGEWQGACTDVGATLHLAPRDGVLDTQLLVWRNHAGGAQLPALPPIEAYGPGPVAPLEMGLGCTDTAGGWRTEDYLVWPLGNLGDDIVTWVTAPVDLGADLDGDGQPDADVITDVDAYPGWHAAP